MEEKIIKITVQKSGADKSIKEVDKGLKSTDKGAANTSNTLDKLSGGAITAFKSMKAGLMSVVSGFKSLKFAIAATGIGLLIIGIAAVSAAFKGSEEGQNKFAKIMAVIGAITGNLIDVLADFGELIIKVFTEPKKIIEEIGGFIKKFVTGQIKIALDSLGLLGSAIKKAFSGDFSGALEDAGKGFKKLIIEGNPALQLVKKLGKETAAFAKQNINEAKAAAQVAEDRAKADIIERDLIIDKAQAENDIAKLRLIAKQQNKFSAKERQTALIEAGKIQDGLIAREKEVLVLRANAIALENTFARSNKENLTSEAQAAAAVIRAETSRVNFKRQLARELTAAENEQETLRIAKIKEREKVEDDAEKKRLEIAKKAKKIKDKELEDEETKRIAAVELEASNELERLNKIASIKDEFRIKREDALAVTEIEKLELEKERKLQELVDLDANEKSKLDIIAFYNDKINKKTVENEDKANKEKQNSAQALEDFKIQTAQLGLNILGGLAEEGSALAKGVAVSQAVISTYQGVNKAMAETTDFTPTQSLRFLNAGLVGAAGALNVAKILSTNSAGSAGGTPKAEAGGGASAPSFNLVQGTDSNQIAQSINQGNKTPTQAFVVGSAVTTQQELDRNKISIGSI